jgi:hypothetical protein
MRSIRGIGTAEAFGTGTSELSNPEEEYMELPITALVKSADTTSPGEVIGGREVDVSQLPIGTKHFYLVATLQSEVVAGISFVELWDVTHGVMVTSAQLSNTGAGDQTQFETFVSAELTQGSSNGHLRTDAPAEYELRLYRSGGGPGDLVVCSNCHLRVIWD